VVDADVDGPVAWMATAYVPGPSLAEAVDTHGPLPEASVLALAAGLAESLNAIHAAGVVHRDLKPSNVLLAEDGPRVIDFGISRAAESTMLTQAGLVVGSPGFMSPEQATGYEVGPPSDVFTLGAVLAFAATGEGPFGTGTTAALLYRVVHGTPDLDRVPATIRPLIEHCLAKDPRQRPTASGLLAEVGALQPDGNWLPETLTRTYAKGTPSRPGFAWSGPVAAPLTGPPPTGLGATRTTAAGSGPAEPPTPAMGAYPPATPPPRAQPPRRRMKPLVLALILGGIVGAGGATAFVVTSMSQAPVQMEQPAAQTTPAMAPTSVEPEVSSAPSSSQPAPATSAPYTGTSQSAPASTYSSPAGHQTATPATSATPTTSTTSPTPVTSTSSASTDTSAPPAPPSSGSASTSASTPASPPAAAPSS
jgi:serine/threonine protein kinase